MPDEKPKLQPFAAAPSNAPEPVSKAFPGAETVTMVFPKAMLLTLDDQRVIKFDAGPQEVPVQLQGHWYLKANKVLTYEAAQAAAEAKTFKVPVPDYALTDKHLKYLQTEGYPFDTIEQVKTYVGDLSEAGKVKFFKAVTDWEEPKELEAVNLEGMLKPDLVAFAKEKFNLDLAPNLTKAAMIQAIEEAAEKGA